MATYVTTVDKLPAGRTREIGEQIEDLEFQFRYFEVAKIPDWTQRVQVRDTEKTAPSSEVNKYSTSYLRGDHLPPIVVTADAVPLIVDGATRAAASTRAKMPSISMFVIQDRYGDAPEAKQKRIKLLGAALNMTHGRSMSTANIEALILEFRTEGESAAALAKRLHCSDSTVQRVFSSQRARERAQEKGVEVDITGLLPSHLNILGGKTYLKNPTWKKLVELARDAKLTTMEIQEVASQLAKCKTEQEEFDILAAEAAANHDRIRNITSAPSLVRRVNSGLTMLLSAELCPQDAVEHSREGGEHYLSRLYRGRALFDKLIVEQQGMERSREGAVTPTFRSAGGR